MKNIKTRQMPIKNFPQLYNPSLRKRGWVLCSGEHRVGDLNLGGGYGTVLQGTEKHYGLRRYDSYFMYRMRLNRISDRVL